MATPLRTPLYRHHLDLGARMVPFAGYSLPLQYQGVLKEHQAVRTAAGLFDVSHMGEIVLSGPRALQAVDRLVTSDIANLELGQARYTVACNDAGGILDDLIVYHWADQQVLIVCNASNRSKMVAHFQTHAASFCEVVDRSETFALQALQGPNAFAILQNCGASATTLGLERFTLHHDTLAGQECTFARTGYTGEDGVEIFCAPDAADAVFSALMEAGAEHGLAPAGLAARDTLRLEAALSLYGQELTETTTPREAGLAWLLSKTKTGYMGHAAIQQVTPTRKLVGIEMVGRGIARTGYDVLYEGSVVGSVTSGSVAPTLGKNIGLAYVPTNLARVGTPLFVDMPKRDKQIEAKVVKKPFYRAPKMD